MDKEVIDYCKNNNYICIDYIPRLTQYTKQSVDCLNDLFNKRQERNMINVYL